MDKPDAPSCARNRDPILDVLRAQFADRRYVLEIGSGTGQHAIYFAAAMPHLKWQCTDRDDNLPGIRQWLAEADLPNTPPPFALDVSGPWPGHRYDAIFSANTLHIMSWGEVERLFAHLAQITTLDAKVAIYGPFNVGGRYTSESNEAFDAWLQARGEHMRIRDAEAVDALADAAGFDLRDDLTMPANNRLRIWQRRA